MVLKGLGAASR
jgi:integrase